MADYKVTNAGSVVTKTGKLVKSGEEISAEDVGAAAGELLRDGKIVEASAREVRGDVSTAPQESALVMDKDGNLVARPHTSVTIKAHERTVRQGELTGIWTCPVDTIKNKSLEELNAMVIERDPKMRPFDDRQEAIAQLSQDVKPGA